VTDTPTLHLERVSEGPVFVHGRLVGDGVRCAIGLPPAAFAALESALDGSWAEMLLEKRDEAINARQLLLDAGVSTKPGIDLVNLVKTVLADVAGLGHALDKVCAQRDEALDKLDAARSRSAAEQDVIAAAREFFAKYEWVYRADQEHLAVLPDLSSHERFRLFAVKKLRAELERYRELREELTELIDLSDAYMPADVVVEAWDRGHGPPTAELVVQVERLESLVAKVDSDLAAPPTSPGGEPA
jgi:hypothetical protein